MLRAPALLPVICLIAACSGSHSNDYPTLVPLDSLLSDAPPSPNPAPALQSRADALRARAQRLRQTDISGGTEQSAN